MPKRLVLKIWQILSEQPLSLGKQEAFEIFKRDYPHTSHIADQKELLKRRYTEAKHLGQEVNNARNEISKLGSTSVPSWSWVCFFIAR